MLGTCFLAKLFTPRVSRRGTPWMALGSLMRVLSKRAGVRVTMALYSPGKFPLGIGTDAVRHIWSVVSLRKLGILPPLEGGTNPDEVAEAPWD